jgi:hypothetical protein
MALTLRQKQAAFDTKANAAWRSPALPSFNLGYSSKQLSSRSMVPSAVSNPPLTYQLGTPQWGPTSPFVSQSVAETSVIPRSSRDVIANTAPPPGTPLLYRPTVMGGGQNVNTLYQGAPTTRFIQTTTKGTEPYSAALNPAIKELGDPGYVSYNEAAFDGPYLKTRYDMGGIPESRVFGVDYPYDMDRSGPLANQVMSGAITSSQYYDALMYNLKINDVDEIMGSTFKFTNAPTARFNFTY